ncbi:hypothetical protein [Arcticibacter svalbardensis]|uniref:hypothetical protein n=1 Tax=Arcticibacter svalbardensis TaxID=1288027 RepID=UPI00190F7722|nr:hypothetical protein [Arcticibacter svalbardensis]
MKIAFLLLILLNHPLFAQEELPVGSYPPAIEFKYFPNTMYAFVWRNWNLVEPSIMAKTIGCQVKDINEIAASMGLPNGVLIPENYKKQMFITVIRRNWHLLPYDQLLELTGMSKNELAVSLRDDDFLFIKLGGLKPKCPRLSFTTPTEKDKQRAKEIKQLVGIYFKKALKKPEKPRLGFIEELSTIPNKPKIQSLIDSNKKGLRFIYSYFGVFGDPLIDTAINPYPDGLLARLAAQGINGVWMHVVLNQLAPGGTDFPEFGAGHNQRIANLRKTVERAKKYGIQVYLYLNEPRSMPASFFENRSAMAGAREGDLTALCTSNKTVTDWMTNSLCYVFKQVPDLGGVFTITASENLTNCASHGNQQSCPRCSKLSYSAVIADVNKAIEVGVHKGNPDAKVIVWDWGWHDSDAFDIISKLPKSVWFMSVSEWKKPFERGGVKTTVGEYSISVIGPGNHAKSHWEFAKKAGLKTVAKVQINNTWELSAVPWLPVPDLVAEHTSNLAKENIDGMMLSWSLGGYPSPNLEIAYAFAQQPNANTETILNNLALKRYGDKAVPYVRRAWTSFSKAFRQFPFSANVIYRSPLQYGPANLLFAKSTNYTATMVGFPYDDLNGWLAPYPKAVFVEQFDKLVKGWKEGLGMFNQAVKYASTGNKRKAEGDAEIAQAAYIHFASVSNQAHFIICRDKLLAGNIPESERSALRKEINVLLMDEISLARTLFEITRNNPLIGFEASNQYYYVAQDLIEKVIDCEYVRVELSEK